jgi:hypothetical protein
MYELTFQHNQTSIRITWNLDPGDGDGDGDDEDESVMFTDLIVDGGGSMYTCRLLGGGTSLDIFHNRSRMHILHLYFHPERMLYILQLLQGKNVVREYYLDEAELYTGSAGGTYTVTHAT